MAVCVALGGMTLRAEETPTVLSLSTGEFSLPPGDTVGCCYLRTVTDQQLNVVGMRALQGPGGHHISVYYVDTRRAPDHRPCAEEDMLGRHFVYGLGGHADVPAVRESHMASGLAVSVPAGKQLLIESHHINTGSTTFISHDTVWLHLAPPDAVAAYAQMFLVEEKHFAVPPRTTYRRTMTCRVPRDLQVFLVTAHMHEFGAHYTLETADIAGQRGVTLLDEPWQPDDKWSPPARHYPVDQPLTLAAGTRLRQICEWKNTTDARIPFPSEMCAGVLNYLSDDLTELVCEQPEHAEAFE